MTSEKALLTLIAPARLEEALVDWLLEQAVGLPFDSSPTNGYGMIPEMLSLAEQVSGRIRKVRFELEADVVEVERLVALLRQRFRGSSVCFRVSPLGQTGQL